MSRYTLVGQVTDQLAFGQVTDGYVSPLDWAKNSNLHQSPLAGPLRRGAPAVAGLTHGPLGAENPSRAPVEPFTVLAAGGLRLGAAPLPGSEPKSGPKPAAPGEKITARPGASPILDRNILPESLALPFV
jgi:hypothetical protein